MSKSVVTEEDGFLRLTLNRQATRVAVQHTNQH
jgi:hypothetical protein